MPAKKDRMIAHIKSAYEDKGYSPEDAERIAYATATKIEQNKEDETNDGDSNE